MKTINTTYNLQKITQEPEAHLSDLFMILYSTYTLEKRGTIPSRYTLMKLFPYIFDRLEQKGDLNKIHLFNLPFYRMRGGHYNKSFINTYLETLVNSGLLTKNDNVKYKLTSKAKELMADYDNQNIENKDKLIALLNEYYIRFINNREYWDVHDTLRAMSHTMIVEDEGKQVTVDDLPINDNKAISYNNPRFKNGKKSNLIPDAYIEKLAHYLQAETKPTFKEIEAVDNLLQA